MPDPDKTPADDQQAVEPGFNENLRVETEAPSPFKFEGKEGEEDRALLIGILRHFMNLNISERSTCYLACERALEDFNMHAITIKYTDKNGQDRQTIIWFKTCIMLPESEIMHEPKLQSVLSELPLEQLVQIQYQKYYGEYYLSWEDDRDSLVKMLNTQLLDIVKQKPDSEQEKQKKRIERIQLTLLSSKQKRMNGGVKATIRLLNLCQTIEHSAWEFQLKTYVILNLYYEIYSFLKTPLAAECVNEILAEFSKALNELPDTHDLDSNYYEVCNLLLAGAYYHYYKADNNSTIDSTQENLFKTQGTFYFKKLIHSLEPTHNILDQSKIETLRDEVQSSYFQTTLSKTSTGLITQTPPDTATLKAISDWLTKTGLAPDLSQPVVIHVSEELPAGSRFDFKDEHEDRKLLLKALDPYLQEHGFDKAISEILINQFRMKRNNDDLDNQYKIEKNKHDHALTLMHNQEQAENGSTRKADRILRLWKEVNNTSWEPQLKISILLNLSYMIYKFLKKDHDTTITLRVLSNFETDINSIFTTQDPTSLHYEISNLLLAAAYFHDYPLNPNINEKIFLSKANDYFGKATQSNVKSPNILTEHTTCKLRQRVFKLYYDQFKLVDTQFDRQEAASTLLFNCMFRDTEKDIARDVEGIIQWLQKTNLIRESPSPFSELEKFFFKRAWQDNVSIEEDDPDFQRNAYFILNHLDIHSISTDLKEIKVKNATCQVTALLTLSEKIINAPVANALLPIILNLYYTAYRTINETPFPSQKILQDRLENSMSDLKKSLNISPMYYEILNLLLFQIYIENNKKIDAQKCFHEAIKIDMPKILNTDWAITVRKESLISYATSLGVKNFPTVPKKPNFDPFSNLVLKIKYNHDKLDNISCKTKEQKHLHSTYSTMLKWLNTVQLMTEIPKKHFSNPSKTIRPEITLSQDNQSLSSELEKAIAETKKKSLDTATVQAQPKEMVTQETRENERAKRHAENISKEKPDRTAAIRHKIQARQQSKKCTRTTQSMPRSTLSTTSTITTSSVPELRSQLQPLEIESIAAITVEPTTGLFVSSSTPVATEAKSDHEPESLELHDFQLDDERFTQLLSADNRAVLQVINNSLISKMSDNLNAFTLEIFGSFVLFLASHFLSISQEHIPTPTDLDLRIIIRKDFKACLQLVQVLLKHNFKLLHNHGNETLDTFILHHINKTGCLNLSRSPLLLQETPNSYTIELAIIFQPRYIANANPFVLLNHYVRIQGNYASFDAENETLKQNLIHNIVENVFPINSEMALDKANIYNVFDFFPRAWKNLKALKMHFNTFQLTQLLSDIEFARSFFNNRFSLGIANTNKNCFSEMAGLIQKGYFFHSESDIIIKGFLIALLENINIEASNAGLKSIFNPEEMEQNTQHTMKMLREHFQSSLPPKEKNAIRKQFYECLCSILTVNQNVFLANCTKRQGSVLFDAFHDIAKKVHPAIQIPALNIANEEYKIPLEYLQQISQYSTDALKQLRYLLKTTQTRSDVFHIPPDQQLFFIEQELRARERAHTQAIRFSVQSPDMNPVSQSPEQAPYYFCRRKPSYPHY